MTRDNAGKEVARGLGAIKITEICLAKNSSSDPVEIVKSVRERFNSEGWIKIYSLMSNMKIYWVLQRNIINFRTTKHLAQLIDSGRRHDIDFSIQNSLRLAQLNQRLVVVVFIFVNLHSEFYNPLQSSEIVRLKEILSLGHEIGIHFDMSHYQVSSDGQLECELLEQVKYLRSIFQ